MSLLPVHIENLLLEHTKTGGCLDPLHDALLDEGLELCARHFFSTEHTYSVCSISAALLGKGTAMHGWDETAEILAYLEKRKLK